MRVEKIKSMKELKGRAMHNTRELSATNADPAKTKLNSCIGETSAAGVVGSVKSKIEACKSRGQSIRKDAVVAVEYVLSASPEWWKTASSGSKKAFVKQSMEWLASVHGRENVVSVWLHRDETSEHIHAMVVPVDPAGRLNCKHFLGGSLKMSGLQDSFATKLSTLGLYRGVKGSTARHTTLKKFGGLLNSPMPVPTGFDYAAAAIGLGNVAIDSIKEKAAFAGALGLANNAIRLREQQLSKREVEVSRLAMEAAFTKSARERMQLEIDALRRDNDALRKKAGVLSPAVSPTMELS